MEIQTGGGICICIADSYGHKVGQTSGDGEGQRGLACCSPCGLKELDMTGRWNNNIIAAPLCHAAETIPRL